MALRDILETCNSFPFRLYYSSLVRTLIKEAVETGARHIVELGAGTAPLTKHLLRSSLKNDIILIVSDLNPDHEVYHSIASNADGRVVPLYESVDFSVPRSWPKDSLLVLSVTFHHLPHPLRIQVLRALEESSANFVIAESVRHNALSFFGCLFGFVFGIFAPLILLNKPGFIRRLLWCWIIPIAPLMFVWDGLASCWRCWSENEWSIVLQTLNTSGRVSTIRTSPFSFLLVNRKF